MWKVEKIVSKGEYNYAIVYGHPRATKQSYVLHHRVVVENHLGRVLDHGEVVHHRNGDKKDNRIENLEVLSESDHRSIHSRSKMKTFVVLKCPSCSVEFIRPKNKTHLVKGRGKSTSCSNRCRGMFSRDIQLHGRTHEVEVAVSGNIIRIFQRCLNDNPEETH